MNLNSVKITGNHPVEVFILILSIYTEDNINPSVYKIIMQFKLDFLNALHWHFSTTAKVAQKV